MPLLALIIGLRKNMTFLEHSLYRRSMLSFSLVHVHLGHVCLCRPLVAIQPRKIRIFSSVAPPQIYAICLSCTCTFQPRSLMPTSRGQADTEKYEFSRALPLHFYSFLEKKHSSTGFARAAIRRLKVTETRYIIVTTDQQIEFDLRIKRNEVCLSL